MTLAPCPTHGSNFRALHEPNFRGVIDVIEQLLLTVSGVGTSSYSKCAVGYTSNFEGIVRALEDLNTTISGLTYNAFFVGGSGININPSGVYQIIDANYGTIVSGALKPGSNISFNYGSDKTITINSNAIISGTQAAVYVQDSAPPEQNGALWFDTNEGRMFVYASGTEVSSPAWYQTNSDSIVIKGDLPPSGAGVNAPARDGSLWFNTLVGNLFVYDATSSGWYEVGPSRGISYGTAAPAPSAEGALWVDSTTTQIKVWDGSTWATV